MERERMGREVDRVRRLARVLDSWLIDPLVGLIAPGGGDVVMSVFGLYIVGVALRRNMSPLVVARMLLNLAVDALLGIVPVIGDVFDLAYKANQRNATLLVDRAGQGGKASPRDWLAVVGAAALFFGTLALGVYGMIVVLRWLVG